MKSLIRKLALSALAIAMLATPALAKEHQIAASRQQGTIATQQAEAPHYPNGGLKSDPRTRSSPAPSSTSVRNG